MRAKERRERLMSPQGGLLIHLSRSQRIIHTPRDRGLVIQDNGVGVITLQRHSISSPEDTGRPNGKPASRLIRNLCERIPLHSNPRSYYSGRHNL